MFGPSPRDHDVAGTQEVKNSNLRAEQLTASLAQRAFGVRGGYKNRAAEHDRKGNPIIPSVGSQRLIRCQTRPIPVFACG